MHRCTLEASHQKIQYAEITKRYLYLENAMKHEISLITVYSSAYLLKITTLDSYCCGQNHMGELTKV